MRSYLRDMLRGALTVFFVCALFAAARGFTGEMPVLRVAGTAALAAVCLSDLNAMLTMGRRSLEELCVFGKTLLPTLCAAEIMGGAVGRAGVVYAAMGFVCDLITTVVAQVMAPLVYAYCALMTAHALCANEGLLKLGKWLKSGVLWALKLLMGIFTAYLALSGVLSGTANAAAVKTLKLASGAVPLIGGALSDAAETVAASAAAVKSVVGTAGILGIAAIVALPFCKFALCCALYKLAAIFAAMTGAGELAGYAENLTEGAVLILAMCAACTVMVTVGVFAAILGAVGI